jgi:predicted DNA-binding transcriptional regulator YafY
MGGTVIEGARAGQSRATMRGVRRADRLFRILEHLQRRRGAVTARALADALEVSERTIYRDVADLIGSGVPIVGEAGVGYALPKGYELPPLMFTEEELEALALGARVVASWAGAELERAADSALARIERVLPERLRAQLAEAALFAPRFHVERALTDGVDRLRGAVHERRKVRFAYVDRKQSSTARTVRPLGLFYWGATWSLGAWCELREGFRHFRLDRMRDLAVLDEKFEPEPGRTLGDLFRAYDPDDRF